MTVADPTIVDTVAQTSQGRYVLVVTEDRFSADGDVEADAGTTASSHRIGSATGTTTPGARKHGGNLADVLRGLLLRCRGEV